MKTRIILIMIAQVLLYAYSVFLIINGNIYIGMLLMTLNSAFFGINLFTLIKK